MTLQSPEQVPISVLIPTFNSGQTLGATLQSVSWADELIVVDSFSSDNTLDLCSQYGAQVLQHEYETPARQKNWAIPQCRHGWVLQLDSDEILEPGLEREIREAVRNATEQIHAYRLPRKNHILGVWVRHAGIYPDYQKRLFRRNTGRFEDRMVHEHLVVLGEIGSLKGHILHYGMESISKQLGNLNRYTRYEADELHRRGRKFSPLDILIRPWFTFCYRFLWQQGFRSGWRGFIISVHAAIYQFYTYAKIWELKITKSNRSPD